MEGQHPPAETPADPPPPFSGRHIAGDKLFRTPPPRGDAPTPGFTQAAGAPASAPARQPAASADLNAQMAATLSQMSAALSAQSMSAIASAAAASAAKAAIAESASGASDAKKTEETPRSPWTDGEHPAFTVDGVHSDELHLAALPPERSGLRKNARDFVERQLYTSASDFCRDAQRARVLDPLLSQLIMVNGGDTATGRVIRTVRPQNGRTQDVRDRMTRERHPCHGRSRAA